MRVRTAIAVVVFWLLIGLAYLGSLRLDAYRFGTGFRVTPGSALLFTTVYTSWAPLTFVLFALLRKPIVARRWGQVVLIGVVGFFVSQTLILLLDKTFSAIVQGEPWSTVLPGVVGTATAVLFFHGVLYVVVFATCAVLTYQRDLEQNRLAALSLSKRAAETERDLTSARLRALQLRLSPHFLFNCLNSISGLARGGESDRVVRTVAQLGDLLRYALETSERSLVSVREELDFVGRYIALQKLRFGDRFHVDLDVESSTHSSECPPFVLQALIENVFTHEVSLTPGAVSIEVRVKRERNQLRFEVSNTRSANGERPAGLGIALGDLERRLELLYGGDAELHCGASDERYTAWVRLPDEGPEA